MEVKQVDCGACFYPSKRDPHGAACYALSWRSAQPIALLIKDSPCYCVVQTHILNALRTLFQHPFGFIERRKAPDDASSLVGFHHRKIFGRPIAHWPCVSLGVNSHRSWRKRKSWVGKSPKTAIILSGENKRGEVGWY